MRILVVDDEVMMQEEMRFIIKQVRPEAEITCVGSYRDALHLAEEDNYDVAFLDIEMPEMGGMELAKRLKEISPQLNVIFATAYSEYAMEAFSMYASGYLLKPVQKENVESALSNLRYPVSFREGKLQIRCFGSFEVFYEGKPVHFGRILSKEILAYLINLRGASANTAELCAAIWEDSVDSERNRHYFRNLISELRKVLKKYHSEDILICKRNSFAIDTDKVDCDYYRFLNNDVAAINSYCGEYMRQYSWAEMTLGQLERNRRDKE
ncbi:MAG: response regulator [Lachnospiraceae bacterium]